MCWFIMQRNSVSELHYRYAITNVSLRNMRKKIQKKSKTCCPLSFKGCYKQNAYALVKQSALVQNVFFLQVDIIMVPYHWALSDFWSCTPPIPVVIEP